MGGKSNRNPVARNMRRYNKSVVYVDRKKESKINPEIVDEHLEEEVEECHSQNWEAQQSQ